MENFSIYRILECIQNDMRNTYMEVLNGQPYTNYMKEVLKSKYDLMQYATDNRIIDFDIDKEIKEDKEKYKAIYE